MFVSPHSQVCPKCDSVLSEQTDGSVVTCDIAHQGERVHEAMIKLEKLIDREKSNVTGSLRIIVGSGVIREEACARLENYVRGNRIKSFDQHGKNRGVLLVRLR